MQSLPGFRDFYPEDFAFRRYLLATMRQVARRFGFREVDAPVLESAELYEKKNRQNGGGEILGQLYRFTDRGGRDVALRPEMTPTLARMAAARATQYRKPLKWFSVGNFYRYERQQKGRLREFLQLNADILGEDSTGADAEMIALTVEVLRAFGLTAEDFVIRLSDRRAWTTFLKGRGIPEEATADFLAVIDKLEREPAESVQAKLQAFGLSLEGVQAFIASGGEGCFDALLGNLAARGLQGFVEVDLTIVRGLAYYTGVVYEAFDRRRTLRALAGGGRYDHLIGDLSDGAVSLPAVGMGMGDVVLQKMIESCPAAAAQAETALQRDSDCEVYVVVAEESLRGEALGLVSSLRRAGWRVEFPYAPLKVGKQFAAAEALGATQAVVVGSEWPTVRWKVLATRTEEAIPVTDLPHRLPPPLGE